MSDELLSDDDVLDCLCWHDPRNPSYIDPAELGFEPRDPHEDGCACDNCYYRRDVLAREILRLREYDKQKSSE